MHDVHANGAGIPALGFGTFQLEPSNAERMTRYALDIGYRHIDTAQMYRNEEVVGRGMQQAASAREDVFLTTKVWVDRFADGDLQRSVEESLRRLDTSYVDLLLLHWPNPDIPLAETIKALNEVRGAALARHIGVSNFTVALTDEAVRLSQAPLVTNQVEYHPLLDQRPVHQALARHGMALTAYCPLAQGHVFGDATLQRIANAHDKTPAQIALRWLLQQEGVVAIPRSKREEHADANRAIFDFALAETEMAEIHALHSSRGRLINPASLAPDWDT
jgi:diketogulonate reductase-like aldo/keto reductase